MDVKKQFSDLTDIELDYVMARSKTNSNADALRLSGLNESRFYSWSQEKRDELNERAQSLKRDRVSKAAILLEEAVEQAAEVKVDGLKSRKDHIKQAAASEILDRVYGKPTQRQEITGAEGGPVKISEIVLPKFEDDEE